MDVSASTLRPSNLNVRPSYANLNIFNTQYFQIIKNTFTMSSLVAFSLVHFKARRS